jgi:gamma-glutamyltranspeptidase / glutathione hydrolase
MLARYAVTGAVAADNHLAAQAGASTLDRGGNAADAAVAAGAAMAVTSPHMCGLGGDAFAVVVSGGETAALNASGRAGSGADPAQLRAEGLRAMPFRDDVRSVTVPGCVDGLVALNARYGSMALADVLAPAIRLAREGFPVAPTLAAASGVLSAEMRAMAFGDPGVLVRGRRLTVPRVGDVLADVAAGGRAAGVGRGHVRRGGSAHRAGRLG